MTGVGKKTPGEMVFDTFNILFLGVLSLIFLYPMIYVIFASFSNPSRLVSHSGILLAPQGLSISGYRMVLSSPSIATGYMNTMIYVVAGTAVNILLSSMGAYVLSRKNLMIRKPLTALIVFTMYFGGGLIPFYLTVQNLGLYNSRLALIIPGAINTWNMIVMRTAITAIPDSLDEAARMDGANDFTILFRIFLPVIKSTLAVMILFYAVQHWNAWFNAMIFLRERGKYPLQLFLREILISGSTMDVNTAGAGSSGEDVNNMLTLNLIKYCTIVVSTMPILCVYPFLQKYFAKGVMIGSVKE